MQSAKQALHLLLLAFQVLQQQNYRGTHKYTRISQGSHEDGEENGKLTRRSFAVAEPCWWYDSHPPLRTLKVSGSVMQIAHAFAFTKE